MGVYNEVKTFMRKYNADITIIQNGVMGAVASLMYCEYLRNMHRQVFPSVLVMVPEIDLVTKLLARDNKLSIKMLDNLMEDIQKHPMITKYNDELGLKIFDEENLSLLQTVFDLYMSENISHRVPEVIAMKFSLYDDNLPEIVQHNDLNIFNGDNYHQGWYDYIVEESVINILGNIASLIKLTSVPIDPTLFEFDTSEILYVDNINAITPIYLNDNILQLSSDGAKMAVDTIKFVTNVAIEYDNIAHVYHCSSNPMNNITVVKGFKYK